MTKNPLARVLMTLLASLAILTSLTMSATAADEDSTTTTSTGRTGGDASDGTGDVEAASLNQCGSGYFCIWSSSNYTGSLQRFSATGYSNIYVSRVGSFYNNRADRVFIHEKSGGGGVYACYGPRAKRASVSGWLVYANAVYLSPATNC